MFLSSVTTTIIIYRMILHLHGRGRGCGGRRTRILGERGKGLVEITTAHALVIQDALGKDHL